MQLILWIAIKWIYRPSVYRLKHHWVEVALVVRIFHVLFEQSETDKRFSFWSYSLMVLCWRWTGLLPRDRTWSRRYSALYSECECCSGQYRQLIGLWYMVGPSPSSQCCFLNRKKYFSANGLKSTSWICSLLASCGIKKIVCNYISKKYWATRWIFCWRLSESRKETSSGWTCPTAQKAMQWGVLWNPRLTNLTYQLSFTQCSYPFLINIDIVQKWKIQGIHCAQSIKHLRFVTHTHTETNKNAGVSVQHKNVFF